MTRPPAPHDDRASALTHGRATRDAYRQGIVQHTSEILKAVLSDDGRDLTRLLLHTNCLRDDLRSFFDEHRWRPTPVYDGAAQHIPLGVPVTIEVQYHDHSNDNTDRVTGRVTSVHRLHHGEDGVEIRYVPARCRNERNLRYVARPGSWLKVSAGDLSAAGEGAAPPLFDVHRPRPRPVHEAPQLHVWHPALADTLAAANPDAA